MWKVLFRFTGAVGFCLFLLQIPQKISAQAPFVLSDVQEQYRLDKSISVLIDTTDQLTIRDILSLAAFKPSTGNLTFGYLNHPLWLKIQTKSLVSNAHWYLEIPAPFLEYVDFYQHTSTGWQHHVSGYFRAQSERMVEHTGHVLPLQFSADSTSTVYIQITGQSPKTFPLYIQEKAAFHEKIRHEDVGYGIFFGILLVMFFYNLIIYLTLKEVNYLLYICTIVCTFLIFGSASGYTGKFIWPENPDFNFYAGRMTLSVLTLFLSAFTYRFLEVKRYSRMMAYIVLSLIPLSLVAALLMVTKTLSSAGNNLITISTLVYISTSIVCRMKGNRNANFFIAAWTVYLVGGLLLTLRNSGVFDYSFWTTHFVEIGAALETILIAFALAYQYRALRQEKEDAQALTLSLQREANEKLERKVAERTEQLSKANQELSTTLETVRQQSRVIEDKNAELDGFFYRISHDLKGPISSLQGLHNLARFEVKDEKALWYIERKHQQVQRLDTIITGLIHLTKLNDQALTLQKIDFVKLIDECLASFSGLEKFNTIEIRKDIDSNIEFQSEWTLLNAIVQNLIENAIKYSGEEAPFVQIIVRSKASGIALSVKDNGRGIPKEHQVRIFEMFYRATHKAHGSGLGLYILKRSVDRLKGSVEVISEEGKGTEFIVSLPGEA
jgi:signal transduction histidine kinase